MTMPERRIRVTRVSHRALVIDGVENAAETLFTDCLLRLNDDLVKLVCLLLMMRSWECCIY